MTGTHDFSGVTNPKRNIQRRMGEAGEEAAAPASAPAGGMSQADFSYGRKKTDDPKKQGKLIEALRNRKQPDFAGSTY